MGSMARSIRIEYAAAVYHIVAHRGKPSRRLVWRQRMNTAPKKPRADRSGNQMTATV